MRSYEFEYALNRFLEPEKFNDFCPNGLLIDATGSSDHEIKKVVTGVSLREALIDEAIGLHADAIIVHHPNGFWKSEHDKRIVGDNGRYIRKLIKAGIDLYGYHLPLDAHTGVGNNAQIYKLLGLGDTCNAHRFMEQMIGYVGSGKITKEQLEILFEHGWQTLGVPLDESCGHNIAICSGSGTSGLQDAYEIGCDVFITGEVRESTTIFAEEHEMTVIAAGHHRSEVFCVSALAKEIDKSDSVFAGVSAEFVNFDNPI